MPILFCKAFATSDGQTFATLAGAQRHELMQLVPTTGAKIADGEFAEIVLLNQDKILDILSTKTTSRPKARKTNGATRRRRGELDLKPCVDFSHPASQ